MKSITVIPEPKHVNLRKGVFLLKPGMKIIASKAAQAEARLLREDLSVGKGLELSVSSSAGNDYILAISAKEGFTGNLAAKHEARFGNEGYALSVGPQGIAIKAKTAAGIFYGIQTLRQLIDAQNTIPCCLIEDWPDLAIRGIHLDLKGCFPTYDYLISFVKRLSAYKINTILIEYEDKFKYERHSQIPLDYALTSEQVRGLVETAAKYHIQTIPLLQCLGHVEYILKHEHYSSLRESPNEVSQYCPSNPAAFELFKELADELIALHPDSRYFHIGGDETRLLGVCPQCKKIAAEQGKLGLYVDYLSKVIKYVLGKGKTPIIWDDILRNHTDSDAITKLPKEVVLMYWKYGATSQSSSSLEGLGSKAWLSKEVRLKHSQHLPKNIRDFIEDMPENKIGPQRRYLKTAGYPLFVKSLPFIEYYRKHGFQMIGAPSINASAPHLVCADFTQSIANIRLWAESMKKAGQFGVITTIWARMSSFASPKCPLEMLWYGITAAGEYCWAIGKTPTAEFDRKFNWNYFGLNKSDITDALYLLESTANEPTNNCAKHAHRLLKKVLPEVSRNRLTLEYLTTAADIVRYKRGLATIIPRFIVNSYHQLAQGTMAPPRARVVANYMREFRADLERLRNEFKEVLKKTMCPGDVEEKINSVFCYDEQEIRRVLELAEGIGGSGTIAAGAKSIYQ